MPVPHRLFPCPGTAPQDSSFLVNLLMVHHYQRGAWYPRGGASEVAFHCVPVIEGAGGAVLVRAPVTRILLAPTGAAVGEHRTPPRDPPASPAHPRRDGDVRWGEGDGALCPPRRARLPGVAVQKGPSEEEEVQIFAPCVISDAGVFNTFGKLLPPSVRSHPGTVPAVCPAPCVPMSPAPLHSQNLWLPGTIPVPSIPTSPLQAQDATSPVPTGILSRLGMVRHGMGSFLVFVGLQGSAAELGLPATNFWIYPHNDLDTM